MDQRCPKICYQKKEDGLTVTACYDANSGSSDHAFR